MIGQRDRDDVGERPEVEEEVGVERRRQDVWSADVTSAGVRPAAREARLPDRHVAAVDHDDDRVRQDPDEGQAHARVAAVRPQGDEEEPERRGEEREPQRLDERDARVEQDLRPERGR